MPPLLLIIFTLQLTIHLVKKFGDTINNLLWQLYNNFLTSTPTSAAEQRKLQSQYLKVRMDMNGTSSQDEFAKWAKLRRQHDKLLDQLQKSKTSSDSTKASFDRRVISVRWLGTNGLRIFLQFWYSKQAIFWIPQGWMPYHAEWLLSFPRAPIGSISIQTWSFACSAIILLASDVLVALITLVSAREVAEETKEAPIRWSEGTEKKAAQSVK